MFCREPARSSWSVSPRVGTRRHECPPPEFQKIASDGGKNTVLFVSDWSRSWLNAPGLAEQIVHLVGWAERVFRTDHTVAIGNSMGGTMALLLSHQLRFSSVTALSPQHSVVPEIVPEETRWQPLRRKIANYRFDRVSALDVPETIYFILHGDAAEEMHHARRFPVVDRGRYMIVPGYGHRLAQDLRRVVRRFEALGARPIEEMRSPGEGQTRDAAA